MPSELLLSPSQCHTRVLGLVPRLAFFRKNRDFLDWQSRLRRRLSRLLGLHRMPRQSEPLAIRALWQREHPSGLGEITKLAFQVEPGADALAYVCLPKGQSPPYRFMICLQGHTSGMHNSVGLTEDESDFTEIEGERDIALGCLRRGYAALALEQRSFGMRREAQQNRRSFHNGCHDAAMRALMLGRTLLGERVYDVNRAIDYLVSRGDVDLNAIGVMGNSGGGTVAIYAAALLNRIGFVLPSCSFCTFKDSIMVVHHCADNYIPNLYRWAELADILGLFAPRPAVIVAAREDPIFPLAGVQEAFSQLSRIYAVAGAADRVRLVVEDGGHRFYERSAWAATEGLWPIRAQ